MAVGCGATCAKVILITFNFLFWLSGIALLVLGIWICADPTIEHNLRLVETPAKDPIVTKYLAYALIGIGGLVFIVGFLGCCGALKENKCLLGLYLFFLIIIAGAEIAAGVLSFIHKDKVHSSLDKTFTSNYEVFYLNRTNHTERPEITEAIDYVQTTLKCCGPTDNFDFVAKGKPRPPTCPKKDNNGNTPGCVTKLKDWLASNAPILIGVACGFGGLEIFGIIFAICLCRAVGEKDE